MNNDETDTKRTPKCPHCKSNDLEAKAVVIWCPGEDAWLVRGLPEKALCLECGEKDIELQPDT